MGSVVNTTASAQEYDLCEARAARSRTRVRVCRDPFARLIQHSNAILTSNTTIVGYTIMCIQSHCTMSRLYLIRHRWYSRLCSGPALSLLGFRRKL